MKNYNPEKYFNENISSIEEQQLYKLHRENPSSEGLNRFFKSFENFVFGVCLVDIEDEAHILLFYAQFKREYESISLPLPVEAQKLANDVTAALAREVCKLNPDKDFFDVYNTFQYHRQSALEEMDYFTYDPLTAPKGTLLSANKPIRIEFLDRLKVLKELYGPNESKPKIDSRSKVYLMVDDRTGLIKIGKSKDPHYRERTLQSQEPQTYLITYWSAPDAIEKELHKRYVHLRKRGEWFKLSFKELYEIKEFMNNVNFT